MKNKIINFFKNKFNLILTICQVVALMLLGFGSIWQICFILSIVAEGIFFVVLGIKMLVGNKDILKDQEMYESLPLEQTEIERMEKRNVKTIKYNKFQAIMYIILGIILVFIVLF